jgi:FixJ family two-component response regulator
LENKRLVAIVDDDESAREAVAALVRSLGFITAEFASASAFLQSSCRAQTACLLTDMRMPGMTGLDLHQHLLSSGMPLPTIIMTAHAADAARSSALHAGVCCYLPKPLEPEELLACLRSALAGEA